MSGPGFTGGAYPRAVISSGLNSVRLVVCLDGRSIMPIQGAGGYAAGSAFPLIQQ